MELDLTQNVNTLFQSLEDFTQKEGVIGKPVIQGGKTLLPVISVTVGYGSGNTATKNQQGGKSSTSGFGMDMTGGTGSGGALGMGAKLSTDAILIFDNNSNDVSMIPMNGSNASGIIDKIPQIISGFTQKSQSQQQQGKQGQQQQGQTSPQQ